ncbi:hypothetical protein [Petrocella sp. FN5]|uniref:hypothetical protein n=1 Tax=Petrocella sp. FN5 TaxID=3032002 RepID=UPI0023DA9B57|nr:hypothetical protein [Petrocella sp. FN5]MDF1616206.1 hypothetical protein [Petrocella sp. FN5]
MLKLIYFKSDLKQLFREPMMTLLFFIPLIMAPLFKIILLIGVPFLQRFVTFSVENYHDYILAFVLLMVPAMLGIVMGFMLLDDKDGKIIELLSVTPFGRNGYLIVRLSFVAMATLIYTFYTYWIMGLYRLPILILIYIGLLMCTYGASIGMIFFNLATDKVKGLTYAKGLNLMLFFVLVDLLHIPWLTFLAGFFPTYWIYKIIENKGTAIPIVLGLTVHVVWFIMLLWITRIRKINV